MENKRIFKNHPLSIFLNNKGSIFVFVMISNTFIDLIRKVLSGEDLSIMIKNSKSEF